MKMYFYFVNELIINHSEQVTSQMNDMLKCKRADANTRHGTFFFCLLNFLNNSFCFTFLIFFSVNFLLKMNTHQIYFADIYIYITYTWTENIIPHTCFAMKWTRTTHANVCNSFLFYFSFILLFCFIIPIFFVFFCFYFQYNFCSLKKNKIAFMIYSHIYCF